MFKKHEDVDYDSGESDYYDYEYSDMNGDDITKRILHPFKISKEIPAELDDKFWNEQSIFEGWWNG